VPELSVREVSLTYGPVNARMKALDRVSLVFNSGRLTLVTGPSGSGKTSLLSVLGCLVLPHSGEVSVMGHRTETLSEKQRARVRRDHIGYVFQAFRLFHSLSALDNVLLAARVAGSRKANADLACDALRTVGMSEKSALKPQELSGGEKQRVAIARVLVNRQPIVLADEPTASLDTGSGIKIAQLLLQLAVEGRIVVVVSHDLRLQAYCHRTVILQDGCVLDDREALR
jgi:putative ABC transport system ATP-binding protein